MTDKRKNDRGAVWWGQNYEEEHGKSVKGIGKHVGKWKQKWKGGCGMMEAEESATNVYAEVKLEAEYGEVE